MTEPGSELVFRCKRCRLFVGWERTFGETERLAVFCANRSQGCSWRVPGPNLQECALAAVRTGYAVEVEAAGRHVPTSAPCFSCGVDVPLNGCSPSPTVDVFTGACEACHIGIKLTANY